jgi:diguanylate cyclase (GGDEF)-like protein
MTQHRLVASEKAGARHFRVELQSPDVRDYLRSSRLVLAGIIAMVLLAALFLWGTITAIQRIDAKGIESERNRAMVAVGLFQQTGRSMDSASARKIGRDYVLENARLTAPASVRPEETYIPLAGTSLVLAWTPHRLATETALVIGPLRIAAAAGGLGGLFFILIRLYRLTRDLEARRRAARALATQDPLTGLVNRRGLKEALDAAFHNDMPIALLYLDLDRFKQVNDRHGHAVGDELLITVAQRLSHLTSPNDCMARLGGDEFVLLRRGPTTRTELSDLASRIHQRITLPYGLGSIEAEIGLSIGIAVRTDTMLDADDLVASADAALYRAKAIEDVPFVFAEDVRSRTRAA